MEIRAYWHILKRRWWLLLLGFITVFGVTLFLTSRQPPVYDASTTFVIRPRVTEGSVDDDFVRALDIVSRRVEINTTFAEVATSRLIKKQAIERLGLSSAEQQGLSVSARVVGGTNVMEISVEGRDPLVTRDFANAVGVETVAYVGNLYDVFELEPLDEANLPRTPSRPNVPLNLAMGGALGLALGACLIFLLQYLESSTVGREAFNIIDRETDAYTRSYLLHRLWGEISRARRTKQPLALGLIRVEPSDDREAGNAHARLEMMRVTRAAIERILREEDVLARFAPNTFAVLLPDTTDRQARNLLQKAIRRVRTMPDHSEGRRAADVRASMSVAAYEDSRMAPEQFLAEALRGLDAGAPEITAPERANGTNGQSRNGAVKGHAPAGDVTETAEWPDMPEAGLAES